MAVAIEQQFAVIYLPKVPHSSLPVSERRRWAIPVFFTALLTLLVTTSLLLRGYLKARA